MWSLYDLVERLYLQRSSSSILVSGQGFSCDPEGLRTFSRKSKCNRSQKRVLVSGMVVHWSWLIKIASESMFSYPANGFEECCQNEVCSDLEVPVVEVLYFCSTSENMGHCYEWTVSIAQDLRSWSSNTNFRWPKTHLMHWGRFMLIIFAFIRGGCQKVESVPCVLGSPHRPLLLGSDIEQVGQRHLPEWCAI